MKTNLTLLLLWLSFGIFAQTNTSTIKVNVEDGCGNSFTKPVTIDLYKKVGNSFNKIATSNTHPASFNNLESGLTYEVRISSSDSLDTDISIKDIQVLRDIILGTYQGNIASTFIGDTNGNLGISTLDIVNLKRNIIQIPDFTYNKWIFIDQANINSSISDYLNMITFNVINNGLKEITFNGYKHGAVASTIAKYCNPCPIDSTAMTNILIPDMDVEAGKEVEFSLSYKSNIKDIGFLFTLKYDFASNITITRKNGSDFNQVDSISSIHILAFSDLQWTTGNYEIAKIKFTPLRSGKLISFFEFNDQFKKEFIYKEGECLKAYSNVSIDTSSYCPVTWPLDITIPDCTSAYNAGSPIINPACINIVSTTYTDLVIGIPCEKIIRSWVALNWFTGDIYKHTQIITIDRGYYIICDDVTVLVKDSAKIFASALVQNYIVGHIYSFSPTDPNQNFLILKYVPPFYVYVRVYDLTDQIFCNSKINLVNSNCADPVNVIPQTSITNNNGVYNVNGNMFDGGNLGHCLGVINNFQLKFPQTGSYVSQASFNYDQYKNTNLAVELQYQVNGIWKYYGLVKINFLPDNVLPPFEFTCFDDALVKDEAFEIAIFSPNFENIYALQGAIRLKDALLVNTKKIALSNIDFNKELRSLRFVWFDPSVQQLSLSSTDTLFTMTILPTKSANVSDILSIADDILISEAVLDDFEQTKINLVFKFLRRPTSTNDNKLFEDISIYPNPSSNGNITIQTKNMSSARFDVYNEQGQTIFNSRQNSTDGTFQLTLPNDIRNGIYMVRISDEKSSVMKKLLILK